MNMATFDGTVRGLFLFNKETGVSSAGFLNSIKRILKTPEKIGHGGTLDPFAEGLLIVGIGREYTRSLEHYLKGTDKTYDAAIMLGASSTTYDRTGIISHIPAIKTFTAEEIHAAVRKLQNREEQIPPPVSAKKIGGIPAYERARRGETFTLSPQKTKLLSYEIRNIEEIESLAKVDMRLRVSSGFYIRSFAHDLGMELGSDGYVENLARTEIGYFKLEEALNLHDLQKEIELIYRAKGDLQGIGFRAHVRSVANALGITGHARNMKEGGVEIVGQGNPETLSRFLDEIKHGPYRDRVQQWQDYFKVCKEKKSGFLVI